MNMNFKQYLLLQESSSDDMVARIKLSSKQAGTKFRPLVINAEMNPSLQVVAEAFEKSSNVKVGYATLKGNETEYPTIKKKSLYFTGPSLRKHLQGVTFTNYQLVTDATPSEIRMILKGSKGNFREVQPKHGKSERYLNLPDHVSGNYFYVSMFDKKGQEMEITAVINGQKVHIATMNSNSKCSAKPPENRNFTTSVSEDSEGRCFTVDAMYIKIKSSDGDNTELLDPMGGFKNLVDGEVRYINQDSLSVEEDPLSALECCALSAQIEKDNTINANNIEIINGTHNLHPSYEFTKKFRGDVNNVAIPTTYYLNNIGMAGLYDILFPDLDVTKPFSSLMNNDIFVTAQLLMDNDVNDVYETLISIGWDKESAIKIVYLINLTKWATGKMEWHDNFIDMPFETTMLFKFLDPFGKANQFKKMLKNARE